MILDDAQPEPHINIEGTVKFDLTNQNYVFRTHTETRHRLAQSQVPQFRTPHSAHHVIGSDNLKIYEISNQNSYLKIRCAITKVNMFYLMNLIPG